MGVLTTKFTGSFVKNSEFGAILVSTLGGIGLETLKKAQGLENFMGFKKNPPKSVDSV